VDVSKDALAVAGALADHDLGDRVTLYRGDLFAPLDGKRYDLIISNPPYVDAEGMAALPRECRAEPRLAFDGAPTPRPRPAHLNEAAAHLTRRAAAVRDRPAGRRWKPRSRNCRYCGSTRGFRGEVSGCRRRSVIAAKPELEQKSADARK